MLLVTSLDGGLSSYGSGIVLDDKGFVLTNLHVLDGARAVYALPWSPAVPSYAAIDGGLARLVFEREKELVPVTMIRGDPVLDLAVVRLDKPTAVVPMKLQASEPSIGEAVVAIGHPEQNFWSVTRGQVSGRHQGLIQHDAAINKGNSGGPLLNARGEVVGINTSFLKGTQGIFYARPIALAAKLVDHVQAPLVLDRSTPEKAVLSCARARELASPSFSQCIHWGSHYSYFRARTLEALRADSPLHAELARADARLGGGPKKRMREIIKRWLDEGDGRADVWVTRYGPYAMAFFTSDDPSALGKEGDRLFTYIMNASRGGRPAKTPDVAKTRGMTREQLRAHLLKQEQGSSDPDESELVLRRDISKKTGLKTHIDDIAGMRRTLKMGLRVEKVQLVGTDKAWVIVGGRNLDGSPYRYSALLSKEADGWREHVPTSRDAASGDAWKPPRDFPPFVSFAMAPLGITAVLGSALLALATIDDQPDGISLDLDMEHTWPVMIELMTAGEQSTREAARALTLQL